MSHRRIGLLIALAVAASCLCANSACAVDYLRDIKPVLAARCFACHGVLKQEAGLRLDTADFIRRGGENGAVVDAASPDTSELIARISETDDSARMPPEGHPLTPEQVAAITAWIRAGATSPAEEAAEEDPRDHWAFRPPVRTTPPTSNNKPDSNPIDAFLAEVRSQHELQAVGTVERSLLLRRVYLDLIGLPPTREQLAAFLADESPEAWQGVVDSLLANQHYGERWGRHWMDVWRYTDWFGLGQQLRYSQKHIWHWRDWIIESLNEDKGYDRMIVEMLAADEIAPTEAATLRATGFLARNYFLFNRTTWLDNTIEHTSKALLGLTMNCSKCHDHKYDPISQLDYYRMRAFFEPHQVRLDAVPGQTDLEMDGLPRVFDAHLDAPTYLHIRGNEKDPDKDHLLEPRVPALFAFEDLAIQPVSLPIEAHRPELRPFVLDDHLRAANEAIETARGKVASLRKRLAETSVQPPVQPAAAELFLADPFDEPRPDVWEQGPGSWRYDAGKLTQSEVGATRKYLRTKARHPQDFQGVLRFRTTGGEKWKSVGMTFDVVGERQKTVYMSAVQGGSKVQVAYDAGAGVLYPPAGKQDRSVAVNESYELKIAVRDTLVNIAIDGKHVLAFVLPVQREDGHFELFAFDAVVEFESIEIRSLAEGTKLVPAGASTEALTPKELQREVSVAELSLATAELKPPALRAAFQADQARFQAKPADDVTDLIAVAAKAARQYEFAVAELAVAQAAKTVQAVDDKNRKKAEADLAAARTKREAASKALDSPGETYPSLRASLKALEGPGETDTARRSPYPATSSGRRTALAMWITDRRNPLTARVAVNHIWMRHFGQPLVESVTDFGRRAKAPPLQPLLDWLAVELMDHDWSMKHLHRLIVTSQAYRLSTSTLGADPETLQADPANEFYWRRRATRMESQLLRDSLLHLAGKLDPTIGGPTIDPKNAAANRRSLYFTHSRDDRNKFLSMFDDADIIRCYRRQESVVPQQALTLANSKLSLEMARQLAERWGAHDTTRESSEGRGDFVIAMFETVLCRKPHPAEADACLSMLDGLSAQLAERPDAEFRSRAALIHALLNHNDFVTIR